MLSFLLPPVRTRAAAVVARGSAAAVLPALLHQQLASGPQHSQVPDAPTDATTASPPAPSSLSPAHFSSSLTSAFIGLPSSTSHRLQPRHHSSSSSSSAGGQGPVDTTPDSDDDFKPQYKKPADGLAIHQLIEEDIKANPVMVYMKGIPQAPMCGFSAGVVHILNAYGVPFKSRNVLEDDELRQGIKSFSQWPTIPQVYVKGDFIGGYDIMVKMHEKGELEPLFASVSADAPPAN